MARKLKQTQGAGDTAKHFVGYHNADNEGRFNRGRPVPQGSDRNWDSRKRFLDETLLNNRLWVVEGKGTPKEYRLICSGIITGRTFDRVHYHVDTKFRPREVTDLLWFKNLLKQQNKFSFGLNPITDPSVIERLEEIRTLD